MNKCIRTLLLFRIRDQPRAYGRVIHRQCSRLGKSLDCTGIR